jgi:hypothetical protein
MRNKGVLFYQLGSYSLILFALIHSLSFFSDPAKLLTNDEDKRVWQLIQTHVFNIGGMSTTTESLLTGFNLYLSSFTLFTGLLNLLLIKVSANNASSLKPAALLNLVMIGVLWTVTFIFFHLPPLILFGLTWVFFLLSFLSVRKS